jgi:hypothetical protein
MIDRAHDLPVGKQAKVLRISRGSIYYKPRPVPEADLAIMRRLDRLHLEFPFAGSRMLRGLLAAEGCKIGRRHVKTLMRRMGTTALVALAANAAAIAAIRTTRPYPARTATSGASCSVAGSMCDNWRRVSQLSVEARGTHRLSLCARGHRHRSKHKRSCCQCQREFSHRHLRLAFGFSRAESLAGARGLGN